MNRNITAEKYFMGHEIEQHKFFKMPRVLLNKKYKNLSVEAKFLYVLLFEREMLSDAEGRMYTYYSDKDVMIDLSVSENTARKSFEELVEFDLIEEVTQGSNKPNKIFVKRSFYNE